MSLIVEYNYLNIVNNQELPLDKVKHQPIIIYGDETNLYYYTILMVCLDHPVASNTFTSPFLQWLVINVFVNQPGVTITNYCAPHPPSKMGNHRYKFIILKQKHKIEDPQVSLFVKERKNFDLDNFNRTFNLEEKTSLLFKTRKD